MAGAADDTMERLLELSRNEAQASRGRAAALGPSAASVPPPAADAKKAELALGVEGRAASWGRLLALSKPEWHALTLAVVASMMASGLDLLGPEIRSIQDNILVYPDYRTADIYGVVSLELSTDKSRELWRFTVLALILRVASLMLGLVKAITFAIVGQRVVVRMRHTFFSALLRQEMAFFDMRTSGEIASRLGPDAETVQQVATTAVPDFVVGFARLLLGMAMMFDQSWKVSLAALALIPIIALYIFPMSALVMRLNRDYSDCLAVTGNIATQFVRNYKSVRTCGAEDFAEALYSLAVGDPETSSKCCWWPTGTKNLYRAGVFKAMAENMMIIVTISIGSTGLVLVQWYAYNLIMDGELTLGEATAAITYSMLVCANAGLMGKLFTSLMTAKGASQRIFEVIDRKPSIASRGGSKPDAIRGEVVFEGVRFAYASRPELEILRGISLQAAPASKTALVGPSGSGKSTILALLMRFYDPREGRVLLDGRNVRELDLGWFRRRIGVVQQEPVLFSFSVAENIRFGCTARSVAESVPEPSQEELEQAAREANAHDFIMAFPEQYETTVGERGMRLSGGQKQRISIARMVLSNPSLMLLDEATSALDAESEHLVQDAMDRLMVGRTVIVVAHRLSTVINSDQIVVVSQGNVVDSGNHNQLLDRCERYQQLVHLQLADKTSPGAQESPGEQRRPSLDPRVSAESVAHAAVLPFRVRVEQPKSASEARAFDQTTLEDIVMGPAPAVKKGRMAEASNPQPGGKADGEDHVKLKKPSAIRGYFFSLTRPELPAIMALTSLGCAALFWDAYYPVLSGEVLDIVLEWHTPVEDRRRRVAHLMYIVIGVALFAQAISIVRCTLAGMAGERVTGRLRRRLLGSIFKQELGFFDSQTSGSLSSRLTTDCRLVQFGVQMGLSETFIGGGRVLASLGMGFVSSWQLALLTLAIGPIGFIILSPAITRFIRLTVRYNDSLACATGASTEVTGGMDLVASNGAEEFIELLYHAAIGNLYGTSVVCWWPRPCRSTYYFGVKRAVILRVTLQFGMFVCLCLVSLIMRYAYHLIMNGDMTYGEMAAFGMQSMNIALGAGSFSGGLSALFFARAALERLFEIESREPAFSNSGGQKPEDLEMEVTFDAVTFAYPSRPDTLVADGLSFRVPAFTSAAFVGSSGSGKSTVLSLLMRFYDTNGGKVLIGGQDVKTLDACWLRRKIGFVQQQPMLFGFDIRENIAYGFNSQRHTEGGPPPTDEQIEEAAKLANAHPFIAGFPDGYRSRVGERGVMLSGGQKQRVAIARALMMKPKLLLFDEATSALDAESENLVQQAINEAMKERTVITVAHRLSTVQHANQIFVMGDRQLLDSGTHGELLERCECYRQLVKYQMWGQESLRTTARGGASAAREPSPDPGIAVRVSVTDV